MVIKAESKEPRSSSLVASSCRGAFHACLSYVVLLTILCLTLTGCVSSRVEQLGNGYEEVTYKTRSLLSEPDAYRITLQYRDGNGKRVLIWPYMGGGPTIHNGVAVFSGYPENFVFAVKAPGPLLEISAPLLRKWSKESGESLSEALMGRSGFYYRTKEDGLEFHFPSSRRDRFVLADWNEISDMMREVQEKGVARESETKGITYLEEELPVDKLYLEEKMQLEKSNN
jgi:hypothetical protein